ncbi:MAG: hypothetical protein FWF59_01680 [Turicibacter sp.]|nr:hypothetical protein [Turicibacter sp.]
MSWDLFLRCLEFVREEGYLPTILIAALVAMLETLLIFLESDLQGIFFLLMKIFFLAQNAVAFMLPNRYVWRFEGLITQVSFAIILFLLIDNWLQFARIIAYKIHNRRES